jgi:hypothetical protein
LTNIYNFFENDKKKFHLQALKGDRGNFLPCQNPGGEYGNILKKTILSFSKKL